MPTMFTPRGTTKRRCSSPRYLPRKVHISEEKVARDLGNLSISSHFETSLQQKYVNKYTSKPTFFNTGTQRLKSIQEIEDRISLNVNEESRVRYGYCLNRGLGIEIDSQDEKPAVTLEMVPEFEMELRKMKRKILIPGSYTPLPRMPQLTGRELVLWQPPSGFAAAIQTYINNNVKNVEKPCQVTRQIEINTPVISESSISDQRKDLGMDTALLQKQFFSLNEKANIFKPKLQTMNSNAFAISPHQIFSESDDNVCEHDDVIMDVDT